MNKFFALVVFFLLTCLVTAKDNNVFQKAVAIGQKKTVKIYGGTIGTEHGYASGIIVSSDGQIITAIGMFLSSNNLRVTMPDGNVYKAEVLKRDRLKQLALLKINIETPNFFDLNKGIDVKAGDWVLAIANPFKVADGEESMSLNLGVISMKTELEVKRRTQDVEFEGQSILVDAIVGNPGSQGGALIGIDGNLIGMIGKVLEYKGTNTRINYGVPIETLKKFIS
jgi:serine protease Do